jgi:hypothetical protein
VVAVIDVPTPPTNTLDAATPPSVTVAPVVNPVPVIVMAVPPDSGPLVGDTKDTAGAATYVNGNVRAASWPFGFVTVTATGAEPAAPPNAFAVIVVPLTTVTLPAATPPTVTVAVAVVPNDPEIVRAVAPTALPTAGDIAVNVGPAAYENGNVRRASWPSAFFTVTTTGAEPAVPPGAVAVIVVPLTTVTLPAATPPTVTVAVAVESNDPTTVNAVVASALPTDGDNDVNVGPVSAAPTSVSMRS